MAVSRESQIDAVELDTECCRLYESQLNQALTNLPLNVLKKIEPEITALIDLAVYVVPLYTSSTLVGHQLLGIRFTDGSITTGWLPRRWYLYGYLIVGINWLSRRWSTIVSVLAGENVAEPAKNVLEYIQISTKILSLLNSLVFLKQGVYPTLLHRALKLRTQLIDPSQQGSTDLTTLTRELLWHSFAEILMFALPLINIHRARRWFTKLTKNLNSNEQQLGQRSAKNTLCAVCNEAPTLPQEAECRHIFCYYCLKANLAACPNYSCPLCDSPVVDE